MKCAQLAPLVKTHALHARQERRNKRLPCLPIHASSRQFTPVDFVLSSSRTWAALWLAGRQTDVKWCTFPWRARSRNPQHQGLLALRVVSFLFCVFRACFIARSVAFACISFACSVRASHSLPFKAFMRQFCCQSRADASARANDVIARQMQDLKRGIDKARQAEARNAIAIDMSTSANTRHDVNGLRRRVYTQSSDDDQISIRHRKH